MLSKTFIQFLRKNIYMMKYRKAAIHHEIRRTQFQLGTFSSRSIYLNFYMINYDIEKNKIRLCSDENSKK